MKNSITGIVLLATIVAQANPATHYGIEKVATKLIDALRINCAEDYIKLLPTLQEFQHLMDVNSHVYGPNLRAAKEEFGDQYVHRVLPLAKSTFEDLIKEGKKRGIVWSEIEMLNIEKAGSGNSPSTITIMITSGSKVHRIQVEDALIVNNKWRLGGSIRFAK